MIKKYFDDRLSPSRTCLVCTFSVQHSRDVQVPFGDVESQVEVLARVFLEENNSRESRDYMELPNCLRLRHYNDCTDNLPVILVFRPPSLPKKRNMAG